MLNLLFIIFHGVVQHAATRSRLARSGVSLPSATITSDVQFVMDWNTDNCGTVNNTEIPPMPPPECAASIRPGCDTDNIDSMPRVWFDQINGVYRQLHSVATCQGPSRAQVGTSLNTLKHRCAAYTKLVQQDPVLDHFNFNVWVEAPYVLNRTHVYALTHVDSSNTSIRGRNNVFIDMTLYKSIEGGVSFTQALPTPHHLVATTPYDNHDGHIGMGMGLGMPSSILKDPKSDYLYVMALANWGRDIPGQAQAAGQCLLRTKDITDPSSWRAWNGSHFSVTVNASPLLAPVPRPADHTCAVLDLDLHHISLLWSTYFEKFIAFGEARNNNWAFALSDDLVTWGALTEVVGQVRPNATITPVSPMPGKWVFAPDDSGGGVRDVPYWIGAANATGEQAASGESFKWKALCGRCSQGPCEPCPGMGDVCEIAQNVSAAEWSAVPFATVHVDFTCGLVHQLAGYAEYHYPTLVDDSQHSSTGADPSLNAIGRTGTVFFVAGKCAGTRPWTPNNKGATNPLKCDLQDAVGSTRRDVVRVTIAFEKETSAIRWL